MDTHLSHGIWCAIGQIRTSSHNLEIETGRFRGIRAKDRICQLCRIEPKTELHHICLCPLYYEIRGRFHCLFSEGLGPLTKVMNYIDQRCLGLFLLGIHRHRENLLRRPNNEGNSQREITSFFRVQIQSSDKQDSQQAPDYTGTTRGILEESWSTGPPSLKDLDAQKRRSALCGRRQKVSSSTDVGSLRTRDFEIRV